MEEQTAVQTEVEQTAEQSNGTRKPSTHGSYRTEGEIVTYDRGPAGSLAIDFTGATREQIMSEAAKAVVWKSSVEDGSAQTVNFAEWVQSGGKRGGSLPGGMTVAEARKEILASPHATLFRNLSGIKDLFAKIQTKLGRHPILSDFTPDNVQKWSAAHARISAMSVEV